MRISDWSSDVCSSDLLRLCRARGLGSGGRLNLLLEGRISLRRLCDRVELLRVQPLLLNGCKHQGLLAFFWHGCVSLDLLQLYSRFRKFLNIRTADIIGCFSRSGWGVKTEERGVGKR